MGEASLPESAAAMARDVEVVNERLVGDGDDESIQDGSLSRCHNRSVSHDSYFRLLMTSRAGMHVDPVDEEGDTSLEANGCQGDLVNDVIYAEISKPGSKSNLIYIHIIDSVP